MRKYLSDMGINMSATTPNHPRRNGQCERLDSMDSIDIVYNRGLKKFPKSNKKGVQITPGWLENFLKINKRGPHLFRPQE